MRENKWTKKTLLNYWYFWIGNMYVVQKIQKVYTIKSKQAKQFSKE